MTIDVSFDEVRQALLDAIGKSSYRKVAAETGIDIRNLHRFVHGGKLRADDKFFGLLRFLGFGVQRVANRGA